MKTQTDENVFGSSPESPPDLIEQIDEAVREYWNTHLQPVNYIWIDRYVWDSGTAPVGGHLHELCWERWGCRAILLDDFFKDKEFKFALKP